MNAVELGFMPPRVTLRPYQADALAGVVREVSRGVRRTLVVMATGGGKTVVFAQLADALDLSSREKILILAHRDELVTQARTKYLRANPDLAIGIEKGKDRADFADRVVIASVQTLRGARLDEFVERWGIPALVVTDEAHHAVSASYTAIYDRLGITANGEVLHVGVTATPKRGDGLGLDRVFDSIAYSISIEDLITAGYLVDLRGYSVQTKTLLDGVHKTGGDFRASELSQAINSDERNTRVVNAYLELARGRCAIVFAADIAHSKSLCDLFNVAGVRAVHVDGELPIVERRARLAAFEAGTYDVAVNADVLGEGYDNPAVNCVILAAPTAKQGRYAQRVGRGTRPAIADADLGAYGAVPTDEGRRAIIRRSPKPDCLVIDVVDMTKRHSLASLPVLLGLPAGFDLRGRSALTTARRFVAVEDSTAVASLVGDLVHDADALDVIEAIAPADRARELLRLLLDSRGSQAYVPVDLLRPKPLPPWAQEAASMTWFVAGADAYRLNLRDGGRARVQKNLVGKFEASLQQPPAPPVTLGVFATLREAFGKAEAWVRRELPVVAELLDARAEWRKRPSSPNQRGWLRHQRIRAPRASTRGDLSEVIDMLK